ncbi:MAG: DUF692 family protein [Deltaproteobacteria bacterium]|jgi:uncharacterized protein (UPF0276 family)|nr:DUF692 family protein [Deltaproteobacteria bacterium]
MIDRRPNPAQPAGAADREPPFATRVAALPVLGLGVSTEYGARQASGGLDPFALAAAEPRFGAFLEVGVEVVKGLDEDAKRWAAAGRPTTYHFLDVNLDEAQDLDPAWLDAVRGHLATLKPAWMCGDAGLWHFGPRDRGHMLLLPPILDDDAATEMAHGIVALRAALGVEVLPENPPGQVFIGSLHLLDFFARVAEQADTGLLLDLAHLAIYQQSQGLPWDAALDALPLERVVEIHLAGGVERQHEGLTWIEDAHGKDILPDAWRLFEAIAPRAPNLKAVVFECERNPMADALPGFERIAAVVPALAAAGARR